MQANTTPVTPDVFGRKQAAQKLGISVRTLDTNLARRRIGHVKLGHLIKFRQCDIDGFLSRCAIPARPSSGAIA